MLGKIVYISNNVAHVEVTGGLEQAANLMNMHVIFDDGTKKILGEIEDISPEVIKARFLGEISGDKFLGGVIRKPNLNAVVRVITPGEMSLIVGTQQPGFMYLGESPLYEQCRVSMDINEMFSNHMAIFGNTGSGKSWGVARLLQNVFSDPNYIPYRSNFFIFDAYGEYHNAFKHINKINPNFNFKFYTTNPMQISEGGELLRIPIWLLDLDDIALLLGADKHSQLPILEKMITLAKIFAETTPEAVKYKNHLIAKAIMTILYTSQTSQAKRNDIFSILNTCNTNEFSLESIVQGVGYQRKFRECFIIDREGEFTESVLITQYISSFIDETLDSYEAKCF